MTPAERAAYAGLLKDAPLVVEFGCGGSTLIACQAGVPRVVSIESDKAGLANIRNAPVFAPFLDRLCLLHGDVGETGHWGHPIEPVTRAQAANYHSAFWSFLAPVKPRAVVLVDGRFRVACALRSLLSTAPGSIVCFHDYKPRPYYHVLEEIFDPVSRVDDMAVFQTPAVFNRDYAIRLLDMSYADPN
jgi:hypothetical protein